MERELQSLLLLATVAVFRKNCNKLYCSLNYQLGFEPFQLMVRSFKSAQLAGFSLPEILCCKANWEEERATEQCEFHPQACKKCMLGQGRERSFILH